MPEAGSPVTGGGEVVGESGGGAGGRGCGDPARFVRVPGLAAAGSLFAVLPGAPAQPNCPARMMYPSGSTIRSSPAGM